MPRRRRPTPVSNLTPVAKAAARVETVPERAYAVSPVFFTGVALLLSTNWPMWSPLRWGLFGLGLMLCVSAITWVFIWGDKELMSKYAQTILAFSFGVAFVIVLLFVAFVVPEPKPFQYTVFRIILALAAAGVGAVMPGILIVNPWKWLRATGAFAAFVIVYFFAPAALPPVHP